MFTNVRKERRAFEVNTLFRGHGSRCLWAKNRIEKYSVVPSRYNYSIIVHKNTKDSRLLVAPLDLNRSLHFGLLSASFDIIVWVLL